MSTGPSLPEVQRVPPLIDDDELTARTEDHEEQAPSYQADETRHERNYANVDHEDAHLVQPPLPPRPHPDGAGEEMNTNVSPQVASLKQMFPDFDEVLLQSILDSPAVQGDQDRAIETLLGMNDPNYHPNLPPRAASQTELDEELARRLQLEEDDQQVAAGYQNTEQYEAQQQQHPNVPYEARRTGPRWNRQQQQYQQQQPPVGDDYVGRQSGGGKDTMTEMQEQFKQIAESGKKSFSSFMTKVKAKIQDFEASRSSSSTNNNNYTNTDPNYYNSGNQDNYGSDRHQNYQPNAISQPQAHSPSYYDPDAEPITLQDARTPPPRGNSTGSNGSVGAGAPMHGYDVTPVTGTNQRETNLGPNRSTSPYSTSFTPSSTTRPQTSASPPPNFDPSKLGLLPKRPVSLLGNNSNSSSTTPAVQQLKPTPVPAQQTRATVDEDELDYVENPFEKEG